MIRCAIYDRVSTDIQVQDGLSLEAQQKALIDYAKNHKYKIVDIYTDEGITARKKLKNRKELMRLLDDVRHDRIDLILVTKLDRWFRNIKDYHNTQAILEEHNCNWKTIFEEYDTSTANGRFAINIMLSVNENECDRDSDRIKEVFRYKAARGEWLGGRPPFGYMRDDNSHLIKNPDTAPIVQEMFDIYFSGLTKRKAIEHITYKYGNNCPAGCNLAKMFRKEIYAGYRNGVQICEPFITLKQHEQILKAGDAKNFGSPGITYLFARIIVCPYCGSKLSAHHPIKERHGHKYQYKMYSCNSKWGKKHIRPTKYESAVELWLKDNMLDIINSKMVKMEYAPSDENKVDIDKIIQEQKRLNTLYQKGRIDDDYYEKEYERLEGIIKRSNPNKSKENLKSLQSVFVTSWIDLYDQLDYDHKAMFWKKYIKEIHLDPDTRKISDVIFW